MRTAKLREISDLLIFLGGLDKSSHCENREMLHAIEGKSIVLCLQFIVDKKDLQLRKQVEKELKNVGGKFGEVKVLKVERIR